ncbi:MAG: rod shape-determining protein MreC [Minisyncoccia bacterium]
MSLFQPSAVSGRRAASQRRRTRRGFAVSVAVLAVLIAAVFFAHSPTTGVFWRLMAPLYSVESAIALHARYITAPFESNEQLAAENATLQSQVATLKAEAADRTLLADENAQLQSEFGETPASQKIILANILARPPELPYDELIVDTGGSASIATGDAAGFGNTLIGKVISVGPTSARIELFSAAGVSTNALLDATTPITLSGQGGGMLTAQVPSGTAVTAGDAVSLPSAPLYSIALVQHIDAKEGSSFKELNLSLPVDIFSLPNVEILSKIVVPSFVPSPQTSSSSPSV